MAIIKKDAYFHSDNGINMIHTSIWQNDEITPVGIVQIAHGMGDHIGRYEALAHFLTDCGYIVCGNDHIGHGKSVESVEELGKCSPDGYVTMLRDMNTLYRIMHKRYPELPYFMLGHSMGSLLVRVYASKFAADLKGIIICGTVHFPWQMMAFDNTVKTVLNILPQNGSNVDIFGKVTKLMLGEDDDLSWLAKSPSVIESYRADPLCNAPADTGMKTSLFDLALRACNPSTIEALPYNLPVLIISGAKDPLGMFGKGIIDFADTLTKNGLDPDVYLYPGLRHAILCEDDNDRVFDDILSFLNRALTK